MVGETFVMEEGKEREREGGREKTGRKIKAKKIKISSSGRKIK